MANRALKVVVALVLGTAVVVGVLLLAQSRDDSTLDQARGGPSPGRTVPARPPRHSAPLRRDGGRLSEDEVRTATQAGNVVLLTGGPAALPTLRGLQEQLGPFDPKLAGLGQSVVIGVRPGVRGVLALARGRELTTRDTGDPRLSAFVDAWLGAPR